MRISPILVLSTFLTVSPSCWAKESESINAPTNTLAQEAVNRVRSQFELLRIQEKDFKLPAGWELPLTISAVENFFNKPLDVPITATNWADRVESADTITDLLDTALDILGISPPAPGPETRLALQPKFPLDPQLPKSLEKPISILLRAISEANPPLSRAVRSISPTARQGLLSLHEWPNADTGAVSQEISARRTKLQYEAAKPFSQKDLAAAGEILFKALDRALPLIKADRPLKNRLRWKTPQGIVMVSGPGEDTYVKKDLDNVILLIDLGGKSIYKTPVATAHENEIRLVIDHSADIQVDGEEAVHGNAGAGVFGIGIFVLPNPSGLKEIKTGSFSQGFGLAGIGALVIRGTAHLSAERSTQGMGIFGVGILSVKDSPSSTYVATRSGQGSALTRGVGIFIHEGDKADIRGGLVQPDPREPQGSVSLCQGVGFGPRAYTGGGVGIAVVIGNDSSVKGSYFSQGVGYWHGLGVFRLHGNRCTTQARRYDMGSGVHSAFGHMDVLGNNNRILNWGVGPSYGWDHAGASSIISGNENEMQTEWGSGAASIGSVSFSFITGQGNKLKLCDHGVGNFSRDEAAYSIQIIDGTANQLQCQGTGETNTERRRRMRTPWSLVQMNGTSLVENMGLTPPEWPALPQEEAVNLQMVDLQAHIKEAQSKPALEEVADLVDVAAAFSLDKTSPRQAMRALVTNPPEKAALLVDVLEPAAIDQLIQLGVAIPAHGDVTSKAMIQQLTKENSLQKKSLFISFLRMGRPSTVFPPLMDLLDKPEAAELKMAILRTFAQILNQDTGDEPGRRAVINALALALESTRNKTQRKKTTALIGKLPFGESFGFLASVADLDEGKQDEFFTHGAPEDFTGPIGEAGAKAMLTIINGTKKNNLEIVKHEQKILQEMEPVVRARLTEILKSTQPAQINAAVVGLGLIAHPDDAAILKPFLENESARVRESAAVALARMGPAGVPVLESAMASANAQTRALALVAVTQAISEKTLGLIEQGLKDNDPQVRLTTISSVEKFPVSFSSRRAKAITLVKKRLKNDSDPDVKLAAQLLK